MGNILSYVGASTFSGRAKVNKNDKDLFKLKVHRDNVNKYIKRLETDILSETQIAKDHLKRGSRKLASYSLLRKRCIEKLLDRMLEQENSLNTMISQIEHSALQVDVYKALKKGSSIMKELNRRFTFEDVEKLRQETQEAIEYQEQIDVALRSMNLVKEQEIEDELNEILNEIKASQPSKVEDGKSSEYITEATTQMAEEKKIEFPEVPKNAIESNSDSLEERTAVIEQG